MVSAERCFRLSSGYSRGGGVPHSAQANTPGPGGSGHTATATGPAVYGSAEVAGPASPPGAAPCRPGRGGPARCARIRGSRCWARVPTPAPSFVTTGLGPAQDSGSHVPRYSCAHSIVLAWQHRSPSGPAVLHLELELKLVNAPSGLRISFGSPSPISQGGLRFQVRRVIDGAGAHRLPGAWQS